MASERRIMVHVCGVYGGADNYVGVSRPEWRDQRQRWPSGCADIWVAIGPDDTYTIEKPIDIPDAASAMVLQRVGEHVERVCRQERAEARAKELLVRMLTDDQRAQFEHNSRIDVTGSAGGSYRLFCGGGYSGNIMEVMPDGQQGRSFCVYPQYERPRGCVDQMPAADAFLGQLLLIATDEPRFLDVAVAFGGY